VGDDASEGTAAEEEWVMWKEKEVRYLRGKKLIVVVVSSGN
jgi:hypothetical protein